MWARLLRAFEAKTGGRHKLQPVAELHARRTRGLFQVRREAGSWICSPVLYGSGITYQPLPLSSSRLIDLFTLSRLPFASLAEDCFILEFFDDITPEQLRDFGFICAELATV